MPRKLDSSEFEPPSSGGGPHVERSSSVDWYDRRYRTRGDRAFGRPAEESHDRLDRLGVHPGQELLDVGCGQGFFLAAAAAAGIPTTGCDISLAAVGLAQKQSPRSRVSVANGEALPFNDGSFDLVTCWGSLEHHDDMERALKEFQRVAKATATLCIRVPNRNFWIFGLQRLFGGSPGTEQKRVVEHLLDRVEWERLFVRCGLQVVEISSDDWYARAPVSRASGNQSWIRGFLKKLAIRLSPLGWTYQFDYLLRARESR